MAGDWCRWFAVPCPLLPLRSRRSEISRCSPLPWLGQQRICQMSERCQYTTRHGRYYILTTLQLRAIGMLMIRKMCLTATIRRNQCCLCPDAADWHMRLGTAADVEWPGGGGRHSKVGVAVPVWGSPCHVLQTPPQQSHLSPILGQYLGRDSVAVEPATGPNSVLCNNRS